MKESSSLFSFGVNNMGASECDLIRIIRYNIAGSISNVA